MFAVALAGIDDYVASVVELLERYGATITRPASEEDLEILEAQDGSLTYEVAGALPDGRQPPLSTIEIRERFAPSADRFERVEYEYELIDHERDYRRAFHAHDAEWFERRYMVVVHEHCERPVGHVTCRHHEGTPVRDGFAAVEVLLEVWTGPAPDCDALACLDN